MKIICSIACLIFAFPVSGAAQRADNSVCAGLDKTAATSAEIILTVCHQARGMTPIPRLRLHFRLYKDGRAEYETNPPYNSRNKEKNHTLVTKKLRADAETVAEIIRLTGQEDFQNAKPEYPRFRIWTDSGLKTSVYFRAEDVKKMIVLNNFSLSDEANKKQYPPSLFALLQKIEELKSEN
ncbi:MAG TPA: hypothetical protein VF604_14685 [Pyrinomonadaceae bacterium]|jgi:hypothetical protein